MISIEASAGTLLEELNSIRAETDRLFRVLKSDALYDRPISQRHRVLFYIGHLESFDSIQMCGEPLGLQSPDAALDTLFRAGIDPDSSHLPSDTPADWPSLDAIQRYVDLSRAHVDRHLEHVPVSAAQMALEHRYMHAETLAYMFHNFEYDRKNINGAPPLAHSRGVTPAVKWCDIPGGEAVLGKRRDSGFGWDNEFEQVSRFVPAFRVQSNKVTNGEYLQFVRQGAALPHFWKKRGDALFYRGMFQEVPLPLDWPVYVSLEEARAYAKWTGKDLLTEEQFHRAAYGTPADQVRDYPWGSTPPTHEHGNFNFKRWDPEPVTATPKGSSAFGVNQLVGNGWEWTKTAFSPFPGFRPNESYPGYSADFLDGRHFVIKGGSPRTAAALLRSSFRNWFRPDYPYVYATFRCVENN